MKDKNDMFTVHGEDDFLVKGEISWYFISIYIVNKIIRQIIIMMSQPDFTLNFSS